MVGGNSSSELTWERYAVKILPFPQYSDLQVNVWIDFVFSKKSNSQSLTFPISFLAVPFIACSPFSASDFVFTGEPVRASLRDKLNMENKGSSVTSFEMSRKSGRSRESPLRDVYVSNRIRPLHLKAKMGFCVLLKSYNYLKVTLINL